MSITLFAQSKIINVYDDGAVIEDNSNHFIYAKLQGDALYFVIEDLKDPEKTWEDNFTFFIDKNQNKKTDADSDIFSFRYVNNTGIFYSGNRMGVINPYQKVSGLGEERIEEFKSTEKLSKDHIVYTLKLPLWTFISHESLTISFCIDVKRNVPAEAEIDPRTLNETGLKNKTFSYPSHNYDTYRTNIETFTLNFTTSISNSIKQLKEKLSFKPSQRIPQNTVAKNDIPNSITENLKFEKNIDYDGVYIQKNVNEVAIIKGILHNAGTMGTNDVLIRDVDFITNFTPQVSNSLQKIVITSSEFQAYSVSNIKVFNINVINATSRQYFVRTSSMGGGYQGTFYILGEEISIQRKKDANGNYEILFPEPISLGKQMVLVVDNKWYPFQVLKNNIIQAPSKNSNITKFIHSEGVTIKLKSGQQREMFSVKARKGKFGLVENDGTRKLQTFPIFYYPDFYITEDKYVKISKTDIESITFKGLFDLSKLRLIKLDMEQLNPQRRYIDRIEEVVGIETELSHDIVYYYDLVSKQITLDKKKTLNESTTMFNLKDIVFEKGLYSFCFDNTSFILLIE